jgi:hypothetical protein
LFFVHFDIICEFHYRIADGEYFKNDAAIYISKPKLALACDLNFSNNFVVVFVTHQLVPKFVDFKSQLVFGKINPGYNCITTLSIDL